MPRSEQCPLCGWTWDLHTVNTEQVRREDGGIGVRPTGWNCPSAADKAERAGLN